MPLSMMDGTAEGAVGAPGALALPIEFSLCPAPERYIRSPVGYVTSFTKLAE
jgi:hypothetical protein